MNGWELGREEKGEVERPHCHKIKTALVPICKKRHPLPSSTEKNMALRVVD
jgi:hypothetical protein